jgi:hypothetical protein
MEGIEASQLRIAVFVEHIVQSLAIELRLVGELPHPAFPSATFRNASKNNSGSSSSNAALR